MKKLVMISALVIGLSSCTKEEMCFDSTNVYVEDGFVKQSFEDGSVVTLTEAGNLYTPFNNTCEL